MQLVALLGVGLSLAGGCQLLNDDTSFSQNTLLEAARSSPDSVKMEILWARFPADDAGLNDDAWQQIDESQLPPAVQRELANNGLRAGIVSGSVPSAITRVLSQGKSSPDEAAPDITGETNDLLADPIVRGRIKQMPRNQRYEVSASDVYPSLPLLITGQQGLSGRTFYDAQAVYALRVDPQPDRTTLVELTPELHHGVAQMRFTGGDEGVLHQAITKDREVFDRLRMAVRLAPGEMLVVMSRPDSRSRLGHYFHTVESSEGPQQKLILIRLAEVPPGDSFDPAT